MCTVSVIHLPGDVLRLACNRDEMLTRPIALPPQRRAYGERASVLPIDPQSDGTWIAANDAGLMFALLNQRLGWPSRHVPPRSRGDIIPSVLHCSHVDDVIRRVQQSDATMFGPFRLIVVSHEGGGEIHSDGRRVTRRRWSLAKLPFMATSSSLGDELVGPPRRDLFDRLITLGESSREAQETFHRHCWPNRPYVSVRMSRADARTVSTTVIELSRDSITMHYDDGVTPRTHELERNTSRDRAAWLLNAGQ
jgi:hypothetical protein